VPHDDHQPHPHRPRAASQGDGNVVWRALVTGLVLTAGFALVEAGAGIYAGSLALISDAGHMATDAASFVVALVANYVSRRPPSARASYGYARAEVLAAFVNALAMLALVVFIAVEAVDRLLNPVPVAGRVVMAVAVAGLAINLFVAWRLSGTQGNLNARGALLHVFGDILGSVAAIVAGAVVAFTGWMPVDPILSIVVALLILRSTVALLRESGGVLMEGVPGHLSYERIGHALAALPDVTSVHDLHVWAMGGGRVALSAHVVLAAGADWPATLAAAQRLLAADFGIDHATLQPTWPAAPPQGRVIPVVPAHGNGERSRGGRP
jgi:cobalt-zinc-cadmium efflux system protein